ncbi:MAG: hypothetical protein EBY26_00165, partial [Microbacteriaceae bacterium]|nr:hypothetical protein [Microbacteriaceae bacterium]
MNIKNPNELASQAQRAYLLNLVESKIIDEANQKFIPVFNKEMSSFGFTKGRASKWIEWFNKFDWSESKPTTARPRPTPASSAPAAQAGYYIVQGDVYVVVTSRQDK